MVPSGGSLLRPPRSIVCSSIDQRDRWGTAPVDALSKLGKVGAPLVRHLVSRGIAVDAEAFARLGDRRSLARLEPDAVIRASVIVAAVEHNQRAAVEWLLDRGADVDARSRAGATLLHAAWRGDLGMGRVVARPRRESGVTRRRASQHARQMGRGCSLG